MQVTIVFDTEKDSLDEFRKLEEYIQNIIKEKGGQPNVMPPPQQPMPQFQQPPPGYQYPPQYPQQGYQYPPQAPPQPQKKVPDKTAGGCRVIEYRDMSKEMSNIFSGKTKRGL